MAGTTLNQSIPTPRHIPDELAPGLDLFAATWLQQWAEAGGSVHLEADGKAFLGFPSYELSPEYVDLADSVRSHQHTFHDALYHGKMRAMLATLEALPYGNDALKAHMRAHGLQSYAGGVGAAS